MDSLISELHYYYLIYINKCIDSVLCLLLLIIKYKYSLFHVCIRLYTESGLIDAFYSVI